MCRNRDNNYLFMKKLRKTGLFLLLLFEINISTAFYFICMCRIFRFSRGFELTIKKEEKKNRFKDNKNR